MNKAEITDQQSYDDAFFNQLRITISILLIELSKRFVYFHFRSVKLHYAYAEETHDIRSLFCVREICCSISAQKITKEIFVKICWQLKTPTRTWKCTSCTMQMSYLYASDFPFKNFCKLTKQAETIRNHQNRFWLWLTIVWETLKLTRYQSGEFSCYIVKSEQTQKHTRKLTTGASRSYYSFPAGDWSLVFDPEKPTFSVSSEHKTTYKRPGSYSLPYFLPLVWKIRKIISQGLSTLTIWSCNVTTSTQEPPTCAWIRADIWRQDGAICSKNRKLSHIIGARGSQDLRSPSPIMAPDYT